MSDATHESHLGADNAQADAHARVITAESAIRDFRSADNDNPLDVGSLVHAFRTMPESDAHAVIREWHSALMAQRHISKRFESAYDGQRADAYALSAMRTRELNALQHALQSLHGDADKIGFDVASIWSPILEAVAIAGIRSGHASEAHRILDELGADDGRWGDLPKQAWDTISQGLRQTDGSYPETVSKARAIDQAQAHYRRNAPDIHPADPRLSAGWESLWHHAKRSGMCDVWDDMAESFGVPAIEMPTRSGYVTVRGSFSVEVYVENVAEGEAPDLESDAIIQAMGHYDLDVDEIDDSELEID